MFRRCELDANIRENQTGLEGIFHLHAQAIRRGRQVQLTGGMSVLKHITDCADADGEGPQLAEDLEAVSGR